MNMEKIHLSVFSGVSMTNEKCYLTGKFARVGSWNTLHRL